MPKHTFANLFAQLSLPVIACLNTGDYPVAYANARAGLLFAPTQTTMQRQSPGLALAQLVHFMNKTEAATFYSILKSGGSIDDFPCHVRSFEGESLPVRISASTLSMKTENDHLLLFLAPSAQSNRHRTLDERVSDIMNAVFAVGSTGEAIQLTLDLAGQITGVSRVYVVEEVNVTTTRNTYEWCAEGVQPAIQDLQNLDKADYPYDHIIASGMFIADDVDALPDGEREILQAQGIRSLAIIPIFDYRRALGYVGFDDCNNKRMWSGEEVQFLKSMAVLLASLIKRRDHEQSVQGSLNALQTIFDGLEDVIYVNTLDDYRLVFVNRSAAEAMGTTPDALIGEKCYRAFRPNSNGPCPFCPIPKIRMHKGETRSEMYVWETYHPTTDKTYLAKDNIVKWVDGRYVHMETATDISTRKVYEEKLRYYASTDVMTGVDNREWGTTTLTNNLTRDAEGCLCFVDLDGLKKANDSFGHNAGDQMLAKTVTYLKRTLGSGDYICRWGGDEFLLWLACGLQDAQHRMESLQEALNVYNATSEHPFDLAFSYGIVFRPAGDTRSLDKLVMLADQKMYTHKIGKRGLRRRSSD